MTSPDQPDNSLVARLTSLQQAHPWMDPHVTTTLAASSTSDQEVHGIADSLKAQVAKTWDGLTHYFDDPVLQKQPTASFAIRRFLTGSIGKPPIEDRDLAHIQKQLELKGVLAPGSYTPGFWEASSQEALRAHAQTEYEARAAGNRDGAVSSSSFLHGLIDSLNPSGIASAVTGFVKSIPADARDLGSFLSGQAQAVGRDLTDPSGLFGFSAKAQEKDKKAFQEGYAKTNQALGGDTTVADIEAGGSDWQVQQAVNGIGTLFLLSGGKALAEGGKVAVKKASAEGLFTRSSVEAAQRGPGVIAKTLLGGAGKRIGKNAAVGGSLGAAESLATGDDLVHSVETGAILGGLFGTVSPTLARHRGVEGFHLPARAFDNIPVLGKVGPVVGKLLPDAEALATGGRAGSPGGYYAMRTKLATPYQFGAVRAANETAQAATVFSLKAHGVAYLESQFGDKAGVIQDAIAKSHPLDPINESLRAATGNGWWSPSIDTLTYVMRGGPAATAALKKDADGFHDAVTEAYGNVGFLAQFQQATGSNYDDLVKAAGGKERLNTWLMHKVRQQAAYHNAETVVASLQHNVPEYSPPAQSPLWYNMHRAEAASVYNDADALENAVGRLAAPGNNYFHDAIKAEMTHSELKPNAYLKQELGGYLDAGDILTHEVMALKEHLLTPQSFPSFSTSGAKVPLDERTPTFMGKGDILKGWLGMARTTTLTSQKAQEDVKTFKKAIEQDTKGRGQISQATIKDMADYAFHNYGLDANKLRAFGSDPEKLLNLLAAKSKELASEVHLAPDAPEALRDAVARMEAKGYQVVHGNDIGHSFRSDFAPLQMGEHLKGRRRLGTALGLNNQLFGRESFAVDRRMRIVRSLNEALGDRMPARYTAATILSDLQNDDLVGKELPWLASTLMTGFKGAHKSSTDALIAADKAKTPEEALALLKGQISSAAGLNNLDYKDVRRILTRRMVVRENGLMDTAKVGDVDTFPLMSAQDADLAYKALQKGFSQTPGYMMGAGKVEQFIKYMPFAAVKGHALPVNAMTLPMMNLPTRMAQLRDTYRFTMSPFFDLRRVFKTNVKMGADGVVGTVTPVRSLQEAGAFDSAHAKLEKLLPTHGKYKDLEDVDRYLDSVGIFGLYNPRHYEAWYVHQKSLAGASDQEIKDGIVRVFQYGKDGKEGRTAAERTLNTVFFPYSFEKTVVRNVGGYLLDHPAQSLVISNSIDAYRDWSNHHQDNPLSQEWIKTHLPVLEEALRLNTFAHGISPGEFGGVNRPIFNMFMPQSWETNKNTKKTLQRFVPAVADFHRVYSEVTDQGNIVRQSFTNGMSKIVDGDERGPLNGRPVAESKAAQAADGQKFKGELVTAFKDVLDYNLDHGTDEEKYHFGTGPGTPVELRGLPITRGNLARVAQFRYPGYDPRKAVEYVTGKKIEASDFLQRADNPDYTDFYKKALTAVAHLEKDDYPAAQGAQVQDLFRQAAADFAEKDPKFLKFYQSNFARSFGPIERVD